MAMSQQERNKRRALIVRRCAWLTRYAAQREIWRKRRAAQSDNFDEAVGEGDLLADLPEGLLG